MVGGFLVCWRWLVNNSVLVGEQWYGGWWVLIWFTWLGCGGLVVVVGMGLCGYCFLGYKDRDVTLEKRERDEEEHR